MTILTTVLRSGGRYTPEWVARLAAGVRRHAKGIERIRCLSDRVIEVEGVEHVSLRHDWPVWWSKMEAFRPDLGSQTTILCDLDTVFTKDASSLTRSDELTVLEDFFLKGRASSALMRWRGDELAFLYERFAADPERWMQPGSCGAVPNSVHGDQVVIDHLLRQAGMRPAFWQERHPGLIDFYDPATADPGPVVVFIGPDKPDTATGVVAQSWTGAAKRPAETIDKKGHIMANRPHTICHMVSSVDGRTLGSRWRPEGIAMGALFEGVHDRLGGGSWIVGRVTGQEFAKGESYPQTTQERFERRPHIAARGAKAYGIVLDAHGKIAWDRADVDGDPIVVVLTEAVSDAHLAGLRADGVSYVFAGKSEIDLSLALEVLGRELGLDRLLIEGGGGSNGSFLRAGLVDEISLVIAPAVDGGNGAPSVFHSHDDEADVRAPVRAMTLTAHEVLDDGAVWLRYRLENA